MNDNTSTNYYFTHQKTVQSITNYLMLFLLLVSSVFIPVFVYVIVASAQHPVDRPLVPTTHEYNTSVQHMSSQIKSWKYCEHVNTSKGTSIRKYY